MAKPRSLPPVSSFGAELQKALRAGIAGRTQIEFASENLAVRFVHRLNGLRQAMRAEAHPEAEQLYRCGIHREKNLVILMPRDSEFGDAISKLSLSDLPTPLPIPSEEVPSAVESFLSELEQIPPEGEKKS